MSLDQHHTPDADGLLYLYGIVHEDRRPSAADATAPHSVVYGRLAALVEVVPTSEFAPAALEGQLGSVEWVAELARRHESKLETAMAAGPVIPARLCTLFSGDEAVRRLLAESEDDFLAALERLTDTEEWGLKIYSDAAALRGALAGRLAAPRVDASLAPGQAFVLAKRREAQLAELAARRVEEVQVRVLDAIESLVFDTCVKRLLPAAASGRPERMIANLGVLVGRDELPELEAAIDELADEFAGEGFVFERSGPWPPYSFTQPDDDVEEASGPP